MACIYEELDGRGLRAGAQRLRKVVRDIEKQARLFPVQHGHYLRRILDFTP